MHPAGYGRLHHRCALFLVFRSTLADSFSDAAQQFDAATKANMIALAQEYRQAEKNTPPVSSPYFAPSGCA